MGQIVASNRPAAFSGHVARTHAVVDQTNQPYLTFLSLETLTSGEPPLSSASHSLPLRRLRPPHPPLLHHREVLDLKVALPVPSRIPGSPAPPHRGAGPWTSSASTAALAARSSGPPPPSSRSPPLLAPPRSPLRVKTAHSSSGSSPRAPSAGTTSSYAPSSPPHSPAVSCEQSEDCL